MNLARRPLRVLAVAGKETVEILRRPSALVSVVAGPVLILGLFGLGYLGQPPLRAELVIPPGSGLSSEPAAYTRLASDRVDIVGVTPDVATAREQLRAGAADIVVIAPADAQAELSQGRQAVMTVEYDTRQPIPRVHRQDAPPTNSSRPSTARSSRPPPSASPTRPAQAGQSLPPRAEPRGRGGADARRGDRPLAERAQHRRLLRDHGPRPDRPAHRDHGQRAVDAPRPSARHVRPVPHVADRQRRPAHRQVRRLRPAGHGRRAGGARRAGVRLRRAVPGGSGRRRRRGRAARAGVDRHRHRRRPGVRLGPPGRPGRPARPPRLGVLQRPRPRPRPVLGPGARGERAAAGDAGGLAAAGPDAARARRPRRGARSCWPRWRGSCSWPGGSSSGASSTGLHERPEWPGRAVRHAAARSSWGAVARAQAGTSRLGTCRPTRPTTGRSW